MKLYDFIFDLDGTLIDSSEAILASLRRMEEQMDLGPLPEEALRSFLGPPLRRCFMEHYHVPLEATEAMLACYRACYLEAGIERTAVFPGVFDSLRYLRERGGHTAIATMKQPPLARETLRRTGLDAYFDHVALVPEHSVGDKAELIRECLERLGCRSAEEAVLFGDTTYDGQAAAQTGVRFVAAGWSGGFCLPHDLDGLTCSFYARTPEEMREFIRSVI